MGTARNMFPSKDKRDLRQPILVEDLIQYDDLNGTGGGGTAGVTQITAGTNVTISSTGPSGTGNVTINASGGGGGGTVTAVTGTSPVVSSGGTTPAISMPAATSSVNGYLTSADWTTFNGKGSGTVTGVTATGPITSSGGTAPVISTSMATNKLIGRYIAGTGVMQEITVGTGLSLSAGGDLYNTGALGATTIQQAITADKSITNDILTIGTGAGDNITANSAIALGTDSLKNINGGKNIGIGTRAGYYPTGGTRTNFENISIGYGAGSDNDDNLDNNIAIGTGALALNQSSGTVAIGKSAGFRDTGGPGRAGANVFIGKNAGFDPLSSTIGNNGGNVIAIGESALAKNTGENVIAIGKNAGTSNTAAEVIALGTDAGVSNGETNSFIISNSSLPLFATQADAINHFSALTTLSAGCTYLYFNDGKKTIEGYRT